MPTVDIRSYKIGWWVAERRGEVQIEYVGDERTDLKIDVKTVEGLAAWSTLLREGNVTKVTFEPNNPAATALHTPKQG